MAAYEVWRRHRAGRDRILGPIGFAWASIIVTSVVSDAATSPYSLFHFDRMSPVGLVTNFVVMPVVTFVTAPLAALTVLLSLFGYGDLGLRLFGQSLEVVLNLTHFFNDLSPGIVRMPVPMPAAALVCLSLALAISMGGNGMGASGWCRSNDTARRLVMGYGSEDCPSPVGIRRRLYRRPCGLCLEAGSYEG